MLGLVPARGGSKGVRRKNLRLLAGKPLIQYTFDAASDSGVVDRLIVSTDDPEIATFAADAGVEVPFLRPAELARDDTPMLPVVQHAIDWIESNGGRVDIVVLLQPTSPLRTGKHVHAAVNILRETGADSVVSVVRVPHHFNPVSVLRLQDGRLHPYLDGEGSRVLRRQDKPEVFARNGAAVYAFWRNTVISQQSLFGGDCRALLMSDEDSVDIDSELDLIVASAILQHRSSLAASPSGNS